MKIDSHREARNQRIVEMWNQNKTSTEIAKELGMTRSAVMGVVSRYGERKSDNKSFVSVAKNKTKIIEVANVYNPRKSVRKRITIRLTKPEKYLDISDPFKDIAYVKTTGKKLINLGPFDCRWIFDDNSYCAQPKTFRSYCSHHARMVYIPILKKEKPRQGES